MRARAREPASAGSSNVLDGMSPVSRAGSRGGWLELARHAASRALAVLRGLGARPVQLTLCAGAPSVGHYCRSHDTHLAIVSMVETTMLPAANYRKEKGEGKLPSLQLKHPDPEHEVDPRRRTMRPSRFAAATIFFWRPGCMWDGEGWWWWARFPPLGLSGWRGKCVRGKIWTITRARTCSVWTWPWGGACTPRPPLRSLVHVWRCACRGGESAPLWARGGLFHYVSARDLPQYSVLLGVRCKGVGSVPCQLR